MSKITYLTEEGLKKLNDELDHLIAVERPNISRQIAEARLSQPPPKNSTVPPPKNLIQPHNLTDTDLH